jgi:hypothetical protein
MTDQLPPYTPSREMPSYNPATAAPPQPYPLPAYRPGPSGYYGGPPSRAMATWALVLGILPIPLGNAVAMVLAVRVLLRGKDGRNHGKGRAIVALVVAPVWLLVNIVLVSQVLAEQADRNLSGVVTQRGDVPITALNVGDCLPDEVTADKEALTVALAPCAEPHSAEVYAEFVLAAGPYPGDAQVTRLAEGGCVLRFQGFTGVSYAKSALDLTFLQPIRSSWRQNNREVTCMAGASTPNTGTLKDAKR